jgi:Fic family protein
MLPAYEKALRKLYTPEVNKLVVDLRQYRQRINRYLDAHATSVRMKEEDAKAKAISTAASCRIDGISVTDHKMSELMEGTAEPKTKKEREVASYRFTLNTIDDSYPFIRISTGAILQLHRDLYRYLDVPFAGRWENPEKDVIRQDEVGKIETRLVSRVLITKQTVLRDACTNYRQAIARKACDPLVAICMFALDILNIHPFADGNGRLSRLMTLLMMYQNGYFVGSYVSLARQIECTKPAYVKAIEASQRIVPEGGTQDDAETDYEPFVLYMLDAMLACCKQFEGTHELPGYVAERPAPTPTATPGSPASAAEAATAPGIEPEPTERQKAAKRIDEDRKERMRQRENLKAQAAAALNNPPRMSKAGESLLAAKEQKVAKAKHANGLYAPYPAAAPAQQQPTAPQDGPDPAAQSARVAHPATSNEDTVRAFFRDLEGTASKREVADACPGMSTKTVERMIQRLMAEGYVAKEGAARATVYRRA